MAGQAAILGLLAPAIILAAPLNSKDKRDDNVDLAARDPLLGIGVTLGVSASIDPLLPGHVTSTKKLSSSSAKVSSIKPTTTLSIPRGSSIAKSSSSSKKPSSSAKVSSSSSKKATSSAKVASSSSKKASTFVEPVSTKPLILSSLSKLTSLPKTASSSPVSIKKSTVSPVASSKKTSSAS
ncbi:hypothetical protein KCU64_g20038, partial [Aureobasidium melanogenum]